MTERSNEQWMAALSQPGPQRDEALADLRALLVRSLGYALSKYSDVDEATLEDFAQDALLKILAGLDSFRGESRFTTWAHKIAVRVAFTELRRHRWRDVSLDEVTGFPMVRGIITTRSDEIGCDECFEQLDYFAEEVLAGKNAAEALPLVQDHLDRCDDCREEFEALLAALRALA